MQATECTEVTEEKQTRILRWILVLAHFSVFSVLSVANVFAQGIAFPTKPIRIIVPYAEGDASGLVSRRPVRGKDAQSAGFYRVADSTAQVYPTKSIRIIVPYAPGGPSDLFARAVGQLLTDAWGQPIVIDNRPGASGNVGIAIAARAPADGYTLNTVSIAFAVSPAMDSKLGYDPVKDLAPISLLATINNLLVVHPTLPAKSIKELIAFAAARPAQVTFASGGAGGAQHLAGELFSSMANVKLTHIPYKGSAPGLVALIGGETMIGFTDMVITLPHVKSGKLRALAVTGSQRSGLVPDLPTIAESGLPGYSVTAWFGVLAPAATPADIVARISAEIQKGFRSAQMQERFAAMGADPVGSAPEQFAAFLKTEMAKWAKLVKTAGIRGE
jgi:tripartite-type tricarboxylate transporter receptor subunit TctC